jgi:hypothetical protein
VGADARQATASVAVVIAVAVSDAVATAVANGGATVAVGEMIVAGSRPPKYAYLCPTFFESGNMFF